MVLPFVQRHARDRSDGDREISSPRCLPAVGSLQASEGAEVVARERVEAGSESSKHTLVHPELLAGGAEHRAHARWLISGSLRQAPEGSPVVEEVEQPRTRALGVEIARARAVAQHLQDGTLALTEVFAVEWATRVHMRAGECARSRSC